MKKRDGKLKSRNNSSKKTISKKANSKSLKTKKTDKKDRLKTQSAKKAKTQKESLKTQSAKNAKTQKDSLKTQNSKLKTHDTKPKSQSSTFLTFVNKLEQEIKHEEQLILGKHLGKFKMPVGIRIVSFYLGFLLVLYGMLFVTSLSLPTAIVFGKSITGNLAVLTNIVILAVVASCFYGMQTRQAYTLDLVIAFFIFSTINSIFSLFFLDSYSLFGSFMFLSALSAIFMNSIIIIYLWSEKKYFYAKSFHERPWTKKDKIFVYILVTFWTLLLLIGTSYAVNFYNDTTNIVDKTIIELETTHSFFMEDVCLNKPEGKEKDVCFIILATMYDGSEIRKIQEICSHVDSDFYKFTCLRTMG